MAFLQPQARDFPHTQNLWPSYVWQQTTWLAVCHFAKPSRHLAHIDWLALKIGGQRYERPEAIRHVKQKIDEFMKLGSSQNRIWHTCRIHDLLSLHLELVIRVRNAFDPHNGHIN